MALLSTSHQRGLPGLGHRQPRRSNSSSDQTAHEGLGRATAENVFGFERARPAFESTVSTEHCLLLTAPPRLNRPGANPSTPLVLGSLLPPNLPPPTSTRFSTNKQPTKPTPWVARRAFATNRVLSDDAFEEAPTALMLLEEDGVELRLETESQPMEQHHNEHDVLDACDLATENLELDDHDILLQPQSRSRDYRLRVPPTRLHSGLGGFAAPARTRKRGFTCTQPCAVAHQLRRENRLPTTPLASSLTTEVGRATAVFGHGYAKNDQRDERPDRSAFKVDGLNPPQRRPTPVARVGDHCNEHDTLSQFQRKFSSSTMTNTTWTDFRTPVLTNANRKPVLANVHARVSVPGTISDIETYPKRLKTSKLSATIYTTTTRTRTRPRPCAMTLSAKGLWMVGGRGTGAVAGEREASQMSGDVKTYPEAHYTDAMIYG
ncbi:hypothetical protein HMN09_00297700 [Mycena chlorophos]|uniref:Uncharacterized protein n=1 Tax=Mycena chlorophos TaxID=658473 RepID=A0A8H6WJT1_MYCCL|nr:hypothetical protein HMN09_00297700 [Mycena chlorophos]